MATIVEQIQATSSKPKSRSMLRLRITDGYSYVLGKTAAVREGEILKSGRQEQCLPKTHSEQLAVRVLPKVARVDVV